MRIIEMFKQTKTENIIDKLIKQPGFFWEVDMDNRITDVQRGKIKSRIKQLYSDEVNKIKNGRYNVVINDECIVVCSKRIDDEEVYYDTSRFYKKDFGAINNFDIDKPEEFKNPTVALLFEKRENVLGLECSNYCIKKYGMENILAAILREMCFFGIKDEDCSKRKEEVEKELEESIKAAENYGPEDYISEDDLWKELGLEDNRTEEEKAERSKRIYDECVLNIKEMIDVYSKAVKEELNEKS